MVSKLDTVVSLGIALACAAALIVGSIQFKNGLTDVNSNIEALDTLPYNPSYVIEENAQTHSGNEIKTAWKEAGEEFSNPTIAQMSFQTSMQPHDPGILADLVVVGTYMGRSIYRYRGLISDVRIDKILKPLADTSKLAIREGKKEPSTYKIPPLNLQVGNVIKIYTELALRATHSGNKEIATCPIVSSPYTESSYFPPLRPNRQYLFCLSYAPKSNATSADTARFRIVPSLYERIPISNAKTFEPNIFCANLPTRGTAKSGTAKPFGVDSPDVPNEEFNRRYQKAYEKIPKFTYHEAANIDFFVDSPRTEQPYRGTATKIFQKYLCSALIKQNSSTEKIKNCSQKAS
ncbi:unnamed protein product [Cylicostephanus goldi]|uniref:Uncharacterized protein n=1 Tax=Cylicostephanus goldi TaxID=71465 RepID=A0A3P6RG39_CYLGO|nr:unnamed protein product [Cylicostephanus goldi]